MSSLLMVPSHPSHLQDPGTISNTLRCFSEKFEVVQHVDLEQVKADGVLNGVVSPGVAPAGSFHCSG